MGERGLIPPTATVPSLRSGRFCMHPDCKGNYHSPFWSKTPFFTAWRPAGTGRWTRNLPSCERIRPFRVVFGGWPDGHRMGHGILTWAAIHLSGRRNDFCTKDQYPCNNGAASAASPIGVTYAEPRKVVCYVRNRETRG